MTRSEQACELGDSLDMLAGFLQTYGESLTDQVRQVEQYGKFSPEARKAVEATKRVLQKSAERVQKIRESLHPFEVGQDETGYYSLFPHMHHGTDTEGVGSAGPERPDGAADAEEGAEESDG